MFKKSAIAVFVSSVLVLGLSFATIYVAREVFDLHRDELQTPLAFALVIAGLLSGILMGRLTGKIAILQSVWVVLIQVAFGAAFFGHVKGIFGPAAAPIYQAAVSLSGGLILLLALTLGGSLGYLFWGDGKLSWSFSFERFLGGRFLMAKRSSRVVSFITLISIFAVMMGSCGMVVVMSVMNGFSSDLRAKIVGANAHLIVLKYGDDFSEYGRVIEKTKSVPGILGASPFVFNEVMVSSQDNLSGAIIKGIDPNTIGQVSLLPANMVEGDIKSLSLEGREQGEGDAPELPGIIIGKEMSKNLHVFIGDPVSVVSPIGELGPTGPVPKAKPFKVTGIFVSGMYEYDSKFVYVNLKEAQIFFGLKGSVTGIEYRVNDIERTQTIARDVQTALGGFPYYTKDFLQMNRPLFSALKLEKIAMFIILTALIFMASLLILVALVMVVMEKGKEIAILKSMGATDSSIMKVFVTYGLTIGSIGAGLGLVFGISTCLLIQAFGIGLDAEVYYITNLPVKIDPIEIASVGIAAVVISFLATVPPSLYAARLRPVEGLRYE